MEKQIEQVEEESSQINEIMEIEIKTDDTQGINVISNDNETLVITDEKLEFTEKNEQEINNDQKFKFCVKKVECTDSDELAEVKLNKFRISEDFENKVINCNFTEINTHSDNAEIKIIPNKLKSVKGFMFFTFCQVSYQQEEKEKGEYSAKLEDFNLLVYDASSEKNRETSVKNEIIVKADDIGLKLPSLSLPSLAGFKFFSNFHIIEMKNNTFIIFLVIYNCICILQLQNLSNDKKPTIEFLFKKEFSNSNLLLFLGYENPVPNQYKFYTLLKPSQNFITFTCQFSHKKGKHIVSFDEKSHFVEKLITSKDNPNLSLSKVVVSNSSEFIFYDKPTNKIYLMSKQNMNKIRSLNDVNNELKEVKNFFVINDNSNLYMITDEVCNSNTILIKLWRVKNENPQNDKNKKKIKKVEKVEKVDNNPNVSIESIECEKIQTVTIQATESSEEVIGSYSFTLIDDKNFALCFFDYDEIFVFNMKNGHKSNQSNLYIESMNEISFHELFAYMFDYQMVSDRILALTLYQEEEFLRYEIDLSKPQESQVFKVEGTSWRRMKKITTGKQISTSGTVSNQKNVSLPTPEGKVKPFSPIKMNSNANAGSANNIQVNPSSQSNQTSSTPLTTPVTSPDPKEREGDSRTHLDDLKKSISESVFTGFEEKLDQMINSKLNNFADNLGNKLSEMFSFIKIQTEELEDIRRKNNEAMTSLSSLIIKSQQTTQNQSTVPPIQKVNNQTTPSTNPNLFPNNKSATVNMMNLYSQQQALKQNQLLMQMNMMAGNTGNVVRPPNWGYPLHLYPSEYIANSMNNLKLAQNLQAQNKNLNSGNNPNSKLNPNAPAFNSPGNNNSNNNMNILNNPYLLNRNNMITNVNGNRYNLNQLNQFNLNNQFPQFNLPLNNLNLPSNVCDIHTENKYKEDEIILENLEKKLSEIKNEEANNLIDGNFTLDLNNDDNKNGINYSSDISSGNLESDVQKLDFNDEIPEDSTQDKQNLDFDKGNDPINFDPNQIGSQMNNDSNNFEVMKNNLSNLNAMNTMNTLLYQRQLTPSQNSQNKTKKKNVNSNPVKNFNLPSVCNKTKKKKNKKKEKKTA